MLNWKKRLVKLKNWGSIWQSGMLRSFRDWGAKTFMTNSQCISHYLTTCIILLNKKMFNFLLVIQLSFIWFVGQNDIIIILRLLVDYFANQVVSRLANLSQKMSIIKLLVNSKYGVLPLWIFILWYGIVIFSIYEIYHSLYCTKWVLVYLDLIFLQGQNGIWHWV